MAEATTLPYPRKKVLVLNGDSYVGRHVVKAFWRSYEYAIEITRSDDDDAMRKGVQKALTELAATEKKREKKGMPLAREQATRGDPDVAHTFTDASSPPPRPRRRSQRRDGSTVSRSSTAGMTTLPDASAAAASSPTPAVLTPEERQALPEDIRFCVSSIVPRHNDETHEFVRRLLANDVIVAVLRDDIYETMCAIRILSGAHYEVEKTFVLISSTVTWAYTLASERATARATRQREREEERKNFLDDILDAEEDEEGGDAGGAVQEAEREARRAARRAELELRLPLSLREPAPGEDEDEIRELVPDRSFTEDAYASRVPHPRFQHWHMLEQLVKRSNTQTLHTYVVFAGLPYGAGEGPDMLFGLLRSAWHHQLLPQYGAGVNNIPTIHVEDLAAIVYKVGSSYDVLEERYLFAVDQGRVTQRQLLQAVQARFGGLVQPMIAASTASLSAKSVDIVHLDHLQLPLPTSPEQLFHVFGNEPCWGDGGPLLTALVLSDVRAEPSAALRVHAEEDWVALEGLLTNLDVVCSQFQAAHAAAFQPVRTLVTGPPLSGADTVAAQLAQRCGAPCVTLDSIVTGYKAHVVNVRAALRRLLMRRLQRRRERLQARLVHQAAEAKKAALAAREQQRQQRHIDGEEGEEREEEEEAEEERMTSNGTDSDEEDEVRSHASSLSVFIPSTKVGGGAEAEPPDEGKDADEEANLLKLLPAHQGTRLIELVVNEDYIRGALGADEDDDGNDGGIDEEGEEAEEEGDWMALLDAQDEETQAALQEDRELLPLASPMTATDGAASTHPSLPNFAARRRGRAFARDVDRQELRCIAALRQEYLLGLKVLTLKVSPEGRLPRPPPTPLDEEEEETEGGRLGEPEKNDEEGEEEEEEEEEGVEAGEAGGKEAEHDDDEEEDTEEEEEADVAEGQAVAAMEAANPLRTLCDPAIDSSAYLDAALAFMFRWRLRQPDCRCQGYVLSHFPTTVAQAVLCFRANPAELEDSALRRQRALAPFLSHIDDHATAAGSGDNDDGEDEASGLPPPMDADFPLPDIVSMEEAELLALERAHRRGRGPVSGGSSGSVARNAEEPGEDEEEESAVAAAEAEADAIMAPVEESLFVDHVVSLQADASVLCATIDTLHTKLNEMSQDLPSFTSSLPPPSPMSLMPGEVAPREPQNPLPALRAALAGTPYTAKLDWYLQHHSATDRPTESLIAWLSAIITTPALGLRRTAVIIPPSTGDDTVGDGGGTSKGGADAAAGEGEDGAAPLTTTMEAPPATRTAQLHFVQIPVLNTAEVITSWCTEFAREGKFSPTSLPGEAAALRHGDGDDERGSALVTVTLPVVLLRHAPQHWTGDAAPLFCSSLFRQSPSPIVPAAGPPSGNDGPPAVPSLVSLASELVSTVAPARRAARTALSAAAAGVKQPDLVDVGRDGVDGGTSEARRIASESLRPFNVAETMALDDSGAERELPDTLHFDTPATSGGETNREAQLNFNLEAEASNLQHELATLWRLQLVEGDIDTATMLQLPSQTYLMKYVLPNLMPALADIVRMRPNDPVSTLADTLFECHRRVKL